MMKLILLVLVCTSLSTMAEAYSNCPRVSIVSAPSPTRTCSGSLLRVSRGNNTFPGPPNAGGKRYFSSRTSFYLYVHRVSINERFVSIRWARNPQYALAEESGQLRFRKVTNSQSATPPEKFLISRQFLSQYYQGFQAKLSKRYIAYDNNCSVRLTRRNQTNTRNHRFIVKCKPNVDRCFCF